MRSFWLGIAGALIGISLAAAEEGPLPAVRLDQISERLAEAGIEQQPLVLSQFQMGDQARDDAGALRL